jgi:hypothetical protein
VLQVIFPSLVIRYAYGTRMKTNPVAAGVAQVLIGSCLLIGCSTVDPVDSPTSPHFMVIQTEGNVHSVTFDSGRNSMVLAIPVTFTNLMDGTVYLSRCGAGPPSPALQKSENETWVHALEMVCNFILVPPIEVAPGETYRQTIFMESSLTPNRHPRFSVDVVAGTYRLVFQIFEIWAPDELGLGKLLPLGARVSNGFRLTVDS